MWSSRNERASKLLVREADKLAQRAAIQREAAAILSFAHDQADGRPGQNNLCRELGRRASQRARRAEKLILEAEVTYALAAHVRLNGLPPPDGPR